MDTTTYLVTLLPGHRSTLRPDGTLLHLTCSDDNLGAPDNAQIYIVAGHGEHILCMTMDKRYLVIVDVNTGHMHTVTAPDADIWWFDPSPSIPSESRAVSHFDLEPGLRRAVPARDGRCVIDGCHSNYRFEAHHIIERSRGGPETPLTTSSPCAGGTTT